MSNLEPKQTLIEITESIRTLLFKIDSIEESGERVPVELMDLVNQLVDKQADKVDSCVAFYRYADNQVDFLKAEKKRLDLLIKKYQRAQERVEYIVNQTMRSQDLSEISGKTSEIKQRESKSVEVLDNSLIPNEFLRMKTTVEPNLELIRAELLAGRDVPGCVLRINKNLRFV